MVSNLIKQVLDFVNLGKVVVDGGPGVVLAVALAILLASLAELPVLPYSNQAAELLGAPCPDTAEETWQPDFVPDNRLEERLVELKRKACELESVLTSAQKNKASLDSEVAKLKGAGEAQKDQLAALESAATERLTGDQLLTRAFSERIIVLRAEYGKTLDAVQEALAEQAEAAGKVVIAEAELSVVEAEFTARLAERITSLRGLFNYLLDHLIGLALVGWVLGTLMNPFNRWLLLVWQGGGPLRRVSTWLPGASDSRAAPQAALPPGTSSSEMALSTVRFDSAMAWEPGSTAERCLGSAIDGPCHEALAQLVAQRSAMFFIGRGVISQEERDALVAGYYRWAEASVNLALPLLVLGISLLVVGQTSDVPATMYPAAASFTLAVVAWLRGRKTLRDHHVREAQFLMGRLAKMAAAAQETAGALSEVVDKAIADLNDLLARIQAAREGEPGGEPAG